MDEQKQSAIDRIKQANNILVTVSSNPNVDQLAALLGMALMLNGLGKHAAAVFSGEVPSTIEFLQPEKTIEKNTDSLRDFIISLDKAKADKLRYKVEDKVVKIFITPYKTSISEKDFDFSQGDFNVEVVVALGVHQQQDLDQAITAHGRILHDATVISINRTAGNNLGTINWQDEKASSLSEMVTSMAAGFEDKERQVIDNQIATALLTGIVSETDRFSNERTTPDTMKASAQLMAAGANQQLVSTKLQEPPPSPPEPPKPPEPRESEEPPEKPEKPTPPEEPPKPNDGALHIEHEDEKKPKTESDQEPKLESEPLQLPEPTEFSAQRAKEKEPENEKKPEEEKSKPKPEPEEERPQIHIDEQGHLHALGEHRDFLAGPGPSSGSDVLPAMDEDDEEKPSGAPRNSPSLDLTPPTLDGTLTANSRPENLEPSTDPLSSARPGAPLLSHDDEAANVADHVESKVSPLGKTIPVPSFSNDAAGSAQSDNTSSTTIPDFTLPEPSLSPPPKPDPLAATPAPASDKSAPSLTSDQQQGDETSAKRPNVGHARDAVADAINASGEQGSEPNPIAALNARPLDGPLHDEKPADKASKKTSTKPAEKPTPAATSLALPLTEGEEHEAAPAAGSPSDKPLDMPLPPPASSGPHGAAPANSDNANPSAPPPVPPPMMPLISPAEE